MKMMILAPEGVDRKVGVGTRIESIEKVKTITGLMRVRMKRSPKQEVLV